MKNYNAKETGQRIKKLRIQEELTQEQLAQHLEINVDHFGRIERGGSGLTVDMAIALSNMFNVSLDFLLLGDKVQRDIVRETIYKVIDSLEECAEKL